MLLSCASLPVHNRNDTLAFCSLDEPSLCPYFASVLTEDPKTGTIPARLASYTFPESALRILRSCDWSQLDFIGEALRIRQLERGTAFLKPTARETYLVEKSLDLIRDLGSRLFFGLNLALAPQDGCSFAEGVDLQIKGVDFAMSLPKVEKEEWLTFLDDQFRNNWLTEGAKYYHSKLRSGRPDAPEAQLSAYLPLDNPFFNNVQARLRRADPVAEFRTAFPTMFASESIALAGTSASSAFVRWLAHSKQQAAPMHISSSYVGGLLLTRFESIARWASKRMSIGYPRLQL